MVPISGRRLKSGYAAGSKDYICDFKQCAFYFYTNPSLIHKRQSQIHTMRLLTGITGLLGTLVYAQWAVG